MKSVRFNTKKNRLVILAHEISSKPPNWEVSTRMLTCRITTNTVVTYWLQVAATHWPGSAGSMHKRQNPNDAQMRLLSCVVQLVEIC